MNAGEKIIYCQKNRIQYFDDLTNGLRWEFFPEWVCGMDLYIDDILYDCANWEHICDSMGLYDEEGGDFIEYHQCSPEQWWEIYGLFVEHMHYYFGEWVDAGKPDVSNRDTWSLPCASMATHFEEMEQEYLRVRGC